MEKKENAEKSNPESPQSCPIRKKFSISEVIYMTFFPLLKNINFFFLRSQPDSAEYNS